jgi:hypothetical protein
MPTAIATSSVATATAFSAQRKVDRCSNGVLWSHWWDGTNNTTTSMRFAFSTDDGATWTESSAFGFAGTTAGNAVPHGSLFIDVDDFAHIAYADPHDDRLKYRRGTPNAARTAWTWSAPVILTGTGNSHPDIVAHREGTGWVAHVVYLFRSDANATYRRVIIASDGTVTLSPTTSLIANSTGTAFPYPSLDFHHTGDGKTVAGGAPHLFIAYSAGGTGAGKGIRFRKVTYASGSWTVEPEREIDPTRWINTEDQWLTCSFDGTRAVVAGTLANQAATAVHLCLYERDAADTTTTIRTNTETALQRGSASFDASGNVHFVGRTGTALHRRRWQRATGTFDASVETDTTGSQYNASAKRGHSTKRIEWAYTDGTASPFAVTYDGISVNLAPNAPLLLSPVGAVTIDRSVTQRFDWDFSDPDAGDSQSAFELQHRPEGAATWNLVTGTTPNTFHDFAAGTFAAGNHEWRLRTADAQGVFGPYSASGFFTAADSPGGPTITDPVSGATISSSTYTLAWSTSSQDAYQVRTVADAAGSPDATIVYQDSGVVESSSTRSHGLSFPVNNRNEHLQVRVRVAGLFSPWASVRVLVSYTPPPVPTIALLTASSTGQIIATVTNPTPATGEPPVISNDVWRRQALVGADGIRIARGVVPNGTHIDATPASGVDYEYLAVAHGDNATSRAGAWTGAAVPQSTTDTYGGGY